MFILSGQCIERDRSYPNAAPKFLAHLRSAGPEFGTTTCNASGVINDKAGKAAALPKFSDTLTLNQGWQIMPTH